MGRRNVDWHMLGAQLFWAACWILFYLIWGKWKWRTAAFGTPEWMFDNYGHALAGALIALQCIYEIRYFFPILLMEPVKRKFLLWVAIPAIGVLAGSVWEFFEMYHDLLGYAVQAQKGGADTTIDIMLTGSFTYAGIAIHRVISLALDWMEPDGPKKEELEHLRIRAEENRAERKLISRGIRALARRHPSLSWSAVRDLLKWSDEDEREN